MVPGARKSAANTDTPTRFKLLPWMYCSIIFQCHILFSQCSFIYIYIERERERDRERERERERERTESINQKERQEEEDDDMEERKKES